MGRRACASEAVERGALGQGREPGRAALRSEAPKAALTLETGELSAPGQRDALAACERRSATGQRGFLLQVLRAKVIGPHVQCAQEGVEVEQGWGHSCGREVTSLYGPDAFHAAQPLS